jgi:hypothetical protein
MNSEKVNSEKAFVFAVNLCTAQEEVKMQSGLTITNGIALPVWTGAA